MFVCTYNKKMSHQKYNNIRYDTTCDEQEA